MEKLERVALEVLGSHGRLAMVTWVKMPMKLRVRYISRIFFQ